VVAGPGLGGWRPVLIGAAGGSGRGRGRKTGCNAADGLPAAASYATVVLVGASGRPWTTSFTMPFPLGFAGTPLFAQAGILSILPLQPRNSFASVQRSVIR